MALAQDMGYLDNQSLGIAEWDMRDGSETDHRFMECRALGSVLWSLDLNLLLVRSLWLSSSAPRY